MKLFEYELTPKSSSIDMYKESMSLIHFITDESRGGVHYSKVNRYSFNAGTQKIEISLSNTRIPEKILQELSKSWDIGQPMVIEQIN